nr:Hypothetical protein CBG01374 [Haemonchus contortus]
MLLILTCLACLLANVAARDVEATLKPLYEKLNKYGLKRNYADVAKFYHSQGVLVKRNEHALYGRERTRDYMMAEFNYQVLKTKEGPLTFKGEMIHIWKREDGKWRIYHEEYKGLK